MICLNALRVLRFAPLPSGMMRLFLRTTARLLLTVSVVSACGSLPQAAAQLPQIRLSSVSPPGAQRGTSTDVTVSAGTDLDEADSLVFSHAGLHAVQKLNADGTPVAGQFLVSVDPVVPPGVYDVRVHGLFGISNPVRFRVDALPEVTESEPNNDSAAANALVPGSIINGRSDAQGDIDVFRITPTVDGTLVLRVEAGIFGSLMQPVIELSDATGRQLAVSRRVFTQEAAIVHAVSAGEDLILTVRDVIYAGGTDYQYRLIADARPFIEFAVAEDGQLTTATTTHVFGRHLPGGEPSAFEIDGQPVLQQQLTVPPQLFFAGGSGPSHNGIDLRFVSWTTPGGQVLPLASCPHPLVAEAIDGVTRVSALPVIVRGAFEVIDDRDEIRFTAAKDQQLSLQVISDQAGSIADPVIVVEQVLTNAESGAETYRRIATEDDARQNPGGNNLPTVSADPSSVFKVPEDGEYRVVLLDRYGQSRGDPRLVWYLALTPAEPDFEIVVFDAVPQVDINQPWSTGAVSLRRGGSYLLPVYAWRSADCNGPIRIAVRNPPPGISCPDTVIPGGQSVGLLVFTASDDVDPTVFSGLEVVGHSDVAERRLVRAARVATLVHDAVNGLPRTTRLNDTLSVGVMKDEQPFSLEIASGELVVSRNQQVLLPIRVTRRAGFEEKIDVSLVGLPANVDAGGIPIPKGQSEGVIRLFFKENAGVLETTLVANGVGTVPYRRNPWLQERAQEKLRLAEAALAEAEQFQQQKQAALEEAAQLMQAAADQVAQTQQQIDARTAEQNTLREKFAVAGTRVSQSLKTVNDQRAKLAELQVSSTLSQDEISATLQTIAAASEAATAATSDVETTSQQLMEIAEALTQLAIQLKADQQQLEKSAADVTARQKAVAASEAAVKAATETVQAADAFRVSAEQVVKQADEATKPNNVNVRTMSPPVLLTVHPSVARVAAAVPGDGNIPRGGTVDVKVTATRESSYEGPLRISLWQPDASSGLSAEPVEIPADQTEAMLTVSAAADAPLAASANLVVRATAVIDSLERHSDAPVGFTVVEKTQ